MLRKIVFILVVLALVAIAVFIVAAIENGVLLGIGVLLLATLIYIFTSRSHIVRGRLFFIGFFLALTAIIALALLALPIQAESEQATRLWALAIGAGISLGVTVIFFFLTIYTASIQVLLTHKEDLSIWAAVWSLASVLLGINQEWLVISEGERTVTNAKGLLKKVGGPGRVVIESGNAVIFMRGGKITKIAGPGVTRTKRVELIKEIFNLRNQFKIQTVENVITADKIPLTIVMGIAYRIKRADNPNAPGVLKDNKGGFPVEEDTILTAFHENTAGKWFGLAAGAPTVQLRDQIMARKLDELFTISGTPNTREIKAIEDAIKQGVDGFAGNKGIELIGADIREIHMPEKVKEAIYLDVRAKAEAQAIQDIEAQRAKAMTELVIAITHNIPLAGLPPNVAARLMNEFAKFSRRSLTDDILGHEYIEMLNTLAKADGTKIFSPKDGLPPVETPIELPSGGK